MQTIPCQNCKVSFPIPKHRIKTARFCSVPCRVAGKKAELASEDKGVCKHCNATFNRPRRSGPPKGYCSHKCYDKYKKLNNEPNSVCATCEAPFYIKPSARTKQTNTHCSYACFAKAKAISNLGKKNPNWRGRGTTSDGYRIYVPKAPHSLGLRRRTLHRAVCCEALGVEDIPKGFHVHHRDCNILNNGPLNLAVLTDSDHKWLHKQYGVATLWAFMQEKIPMAELCNWSDDPARAERLLPINVLNQLASDLWPNQ